MKKKKLLSLQSIILYAMVIPSECLITNILLYANSYKIGLDIRLCLC